MHSITIPKQVFKMREFTGSAGNKVSVTGFVFIEKDTHYEGEAVGDHKELLTKHIESQEPLEISDDNMSFNERFGNWKVKLPRAGGGGAGRPPWQGNSAAGGGGASATRSYGNKYEGEKLAPGRWMEVTESIYLNTLDMMERHGATPSDPKVIEQTRALVAQFWIAVEHNMIDLEKPLPDLIRSASVREVKAAMGGGEVVDEIDTDPSRTSNAHDLGDLALSYYRERLSKLSTQNEVIQLEGIIKHSEEISGKEEAIILKECAARKRLLAKAA